MGRVVSVTPEDSSGTIINIPFLVIPMMNGSSKGQLRASGAITTLNYDNCRRKTSMSDPIWAIGSMLTMRWGNLTSQTDAAQLYNQSQLRFIKPLDGQSLLQLSRDYCSTLWL